MSIGVNFDRNLSWISHIEAFASCTSKRLSLLSIMAGSKWSCSRTTLNQAFSAYVLQVMTYYEPLVTAPKKVTDSLEKLPNPVLRLITGAIKFTPSGYMLLCSNSRPTSLIIKECDLLWERIIRISDCMTMWNHISIETELALKTQRGLHWGAALISDFKINFVAQ